MGEGKERMKEGRKGGEKEGSHISIQTNVERIFSFIKIRNFFFSYQELNREFTLASQACILLS